MSGALMPLTGAVLGSIFFPGVGTAIGAGLGTAGGTAAGALTGAALGGLAGAAVGGVMTPPKIPAAPAPAVMPVMDQNAINKSIMQQSILASATSGRSSTILSQTQGTTDKLGG